MAPTPSPAAALPGNFEVPRWGPRRGIPPRERRERHQRHEGLGTFILVLAGLVTGGRPGAGTGTRMPVSAAETEFAA